MTRSFFRLHKVLSVVAVTSLIILWYFSRQLPYWQFAESALMSFGIQPPSYDIQTLNNKTDEDIDHAELADPNAGVYFRENSNVLPLKEPALGIYIDLEKFRKEVKAKYKVCASVKDPASFWKSNLSSNTKFTSLLDIERIQVASWCGGILTPEFLNKALRSELYPFELIYLSEPPVWNSSTVTSHLTSTISLVGSNSDFKVGDTATFVIKMADMYGRPKVRGGDRVKVWLKDTKFRHSISTKITDFDNGTYLASAILPWAGTVRVMAILREPREFFRALTYVFSTVKSTTTFGGAYVNKKASEAVPCSPFPILPGFNESELCNLTAVNGSPWYCGKPSKAELQCSDLHLIGYIRYPLNLPVTPAEAALLNMTINKRNFLQGQVTFTVRPDKSGGLRLKEPSLLCSQVSPKLTWRQPIPPGYIYQKMWKPFICRVPDELPRTCFQNIKMLLYGDSNSREWFETVRKISRCKEPGNRTTSMKHTVLACSNQMDNFTVKFIPHSSPFYTSAVRTIAEYHN